MKWFFALSLAVQALLVTPDRNAEVLVLFDATSWHRHLSRGNRESFRALRKLATIYGNSGYTMKVAFDAFGNRTGTCYGYYRPFDYDFRNWRYPLYRPFQFDVIPGDDQSDRNTGNALRHAVSAYRWHKDEYTRRVVVVMSDDLGSFGDGNPEDPALFPVCPQPLPTDSEVRDSIESARTGILQLICHEDESGAKRRIAERYYARTNLTDIKIADVLALSRDLSILLSPQWIASTTTRRPLHPYVPIPVDPVSHTQIWFLLDAATSLTGPHRLEDALQNSANHLKALFWEFYDHPRYALYVGASHFGGVLGTRWTPQLDLTGNYYEVAEKMVNPQREDLDGAADRNTWQNVIQAASAFNHRLESRKLIVLMTDHLGGYGVPVTDPVTDPVSDQVSPEMTPAAEVVKASLEAQRTGLLVVMFNVPADAQPEVTRTVNQLMYGDFADLMILFLDDVETDIDAKIREMVGKEWVSRVQVSYTSLSTSSV